MSSPIDGMSDKEIDAALIALGPLGAWAADCIKRKERGFEVAHDQAMSNGAEANRLGALLDEAVDLLRNRCCGSGVRNDGMRWEFLDKIDKLRMTS